MTCDFNRITLGAVLRIYRNILTMQRKNVVHRGGWVRGRAMSETTRM